MNLKVLMPALILLAVFAPQTRAETKTTVDRKAAADGKRPEETARRVFEGSQFWWKHRSKVVDPTPKWGFLSVLRQAIEGVLRFVVAALEQIFRFLRWLMPSWVPRLGVAAGIGSGLFWALVASGLAVLSLIVYRVLRRRRRPAAGDLAAEQLEEPERLPDALVLMARAKAALEAGDTFEALRLGFQAVLAGLEDRGIVRYHPARTNNEYARDLRPQPALAAGFRRIAVPFDRAFYGRIRPERVDVERALEFCQSLMVAGAVSG